MCIRGVRSSVHRFVRASPIDLVVEAARLDFDFLFVFCIARLFFYLLLVFVLDLVDASCYPKKFFNIVPSKQDR